MTRPTMLDIHRARVAEQATAPLSGPPSAMPAAFLGFADLDIGDDVSAFIEATEVRDRIGPDLLRLVVSVHGAEDLRKMIVNARSPAFWLDLDRGDEFRAFHRLLEIRAVTAQAAAVKRRH